MRKIWFFCFLLMLPFIMLNFYIFRFKKTPGISIKTSLFQVKNQTEDSWKKKRQDILSKNYLTSIQDIEFPPSQQKIYKVAAITFEQLRNNKFSVQDHKLRSVDFVYKNSTIKLLYTKAEAGLVRQLGAYKDCVYEPATTLALTKVIRPYSKIIEAGNYFGFHTIEIASLLDETKGGKLFSFDANAINMQFINASILINNFTKRVELYNYAIYNQTQEMLFNIYSKGYWNQIDVMQQKRKESGVKSQKIDRQDKLNTIKKIKILSISLDDFFLPEILPEVHVIKLDIEQADLMGIQGAHKLIRRSKEVTIIIELFLGMYKVLGKTYIEEQLQ